MRGVAAQELQARFAWDGRESQTYYPRNSPRSAEVPQPPRVHPEAQVTVGHEGKPVREPLLYHRVVGGGREAQAPGCSQH